MKRLAISLALFAVAGLAAAGAPAATRHEQPTPTVRHLRARLRALRAEVHTLTTERSAMRTELANATRQLAKAKAHVMPTPLAVAVRQVRHEVRWAQGSMTAPLRGELVAEAAMDYVVGHVSTGAYGYLELVYGETPGGPDLPSYSEGINKILGSQTGICVQAERTFAAIVKALGLRVRDIGFDYVDLNGKPGAHAAAEVYYDGGWHFFDPTFGQFWIDATGNVLSIAEVRAGLGVRVKDDAAFTNLIENGEVGRDYTWFETAPSTTVVVVPHKRHG